MSPQDLATLALRRWSELRAQNVPCKDRVLDPEFQKYERDLEVIRQCMERRT
ncbi:MULTISPECIES: hypothetical protein [unclassified Bradyrhizobium]|uniref:hypothetical protein n=1 Tax=unclassified Bradyrhizobium TaxID=2631580 RepID=UPI0028F09F92|nr:MULTISPECIES: hypothetical protein [unclassified Bradyrhizobium]